MKFKGKDGKSLHDKLFAAELESLVANVDIKKMILEHLDAKKDIDDPELHKRLLENH